MKGNMTKYYKAVREDYTDFATQTIDYSVGNTVVHPNPGRKGGDDASGYFSVSTSPTACIGSYWPVRLLEVEVDDEGVWAPHPDSEDDYALKRATHKMTVVRELDPHLFFGPQGERVVQIIEQAKALDSLKYKSEKVYNALDKFDNIHQRNVRRRWYDRSWDIVYGREAAYNGIGYSSVTSLARMVLLKDKLDPNERGDAALLAAIAEAETAWDNMIEDLNRSWFDKVKKFFTGK